MSGDILTPWEHLMMDMSIDDWLDMNPCPCEGRCECDDKNDKDLS